MNVNIEELLSSKRDLSEEEFNKNPELAYLVDDYGFDVVRDKIFIADGWYILSQVELNCCASVDQINSSSTTSYNGVNFVTYIEHATAKILFDNCTLGNSPTANKLLVIRADIVFNNCTSANDYTNTIYGYRFKKEIYLNNSNIDFNDCTFEDNFKCENVNFNVNFSRNKFLKDFVFSALQSRRIDFEYAQFCANASFKVKQKIDNANFCDAKFKNNVRFEKMQFGDGLIDFSEVEFDKSILFYECKFNGETRFNNTVFGGPANFMGTKFNNIVYLNATNFIGEAEFYGAKFEHEAYFSNTVFNEKAHFTNAIFAKEVKFNNILFKNNAYFRNTIFKDFADFGETNFEKNTNFYSAKFEKPINFSSIIFSGALNFVNTKTDFTYEELKKFIEDKSANDIDKCISTTNDFRDGFRLMKHALNNKGNALDASLFHRLELYCKELELEFTLENTETKNKEVKSVDKVEAKPKSKSSIELFLDLITLKLYRNTSDHHTNLLRIINFMALTVAVYGFSIFMYEKIISKYLISLPYNFVYSILLVTLGVILWVTYHRIAKYNIAWINMLLVGLVMLMIILVVAISAKYTAYIALFITLYLFLYYKAITKSKYDLACLFYYGCFIAIFFIKPFLIAPFISIFTSEQAIESKFKEYTIRYNENGLDDMLLDANLTNTKKDNKLDFIVENRKTILDELDNDKVLLNDFVEKSIRCAESFMNHNMSNKNMQKKEAPQKPYAEALAALKYDEIMQSTRKTANLLYGFIMLLVVYSLTKTARRNSVVPS